MCGCVYVRVFLLVCVEVFFGLKLMYSPANAAYWNTSSSRWLWLPLPTILHGELHDGGVRLHYKISIALFINKIRNIVPEFPSLIYIYIYIYGEGEGT